MNDLLIAQSHEKKLTTTQSTRSKIETASRNVQVARTSTEEGTENITEQCKNVVDGSLK